MTLLKVAQGAKTELLKVEQAEQRLKQAKQSVNEQMRLKLEKQWLKIVKYRQKEHKRG